MNPTEYKLCSAFIPGKYSSTVWILWKLNEILMVLWVEIFLQLLQPVDWDMPDKMLIEEQILEIQVSYAPIKIQSSSQRVVRVSESFKAEAIQKVVNGYCCGWRWSCLDESIFEFVLTRKPACRLRDACSKTDPNQCVDVDESKTELATTKKSDRWMMREAVASAGFLFEFVLTRRLGAQLRDACSKRSTNQAAREN